MSADGDPAKGDTDAGGTTVLTQDPPAGPTDEPKGPVTEPKDEPKKPEGPPEKYESFTVPKGVELDEGMLGEYASVARELGLTQEAAQKLVDLAVKNSGVALEAQQAQWAEVRQGWVKEITNDKDFGGNKLTETVEGAKRVLSKFGSPALTEFLESTGYGDNPDIIRLLAKVDKATREDRIVDGQPSSATVVRNPAQILYPNQGK